MDFIFIEVNNCSPNKVEMSMESYKKLVKALEDFDKIEKEAYNRGHDEGFTFGYDAGYSDGFNSGQHRCNKKIEKDDFLDFTKTIEGNSNIVTKLTVE